VRARPSTSARTPRLLAPRGRGARTAISGVAAISARASQVRSRAARRRCSRHAR
jgi:hypothetical protein